MIYEYEIEGIHLKTGDLICTIDGTNDNICGKIWFLVGKIIPGDVDHIAIYVGPGGRCVEAGACFKVVTFNTAQSWDASKMHDERGPILDRLYGIAYPLKNRDLSLEKENAIRESVAKYCLKQAEEEKPYNLNYFDSDTTNAFYCSQLAYKAYLEEGINLNTNIGVPQIPFTDKIIYPQELWNECAHIKASA